jgi:hypothetical protein
VGDEKQLIKRIVGKGAEETEVGEEENLGSLTPLTGLPDSIFSNKKIVFGGSCNGRCRYILLPFG